MPREAASAYEIRHAAVVGAGVMGAQLAALLANSGITCCLLDVVPSELLPEEQAKGLTLDSLEVRNRIARQGLERAKRARPPAFYLPEFAQRITIGNIADHKHFLHEADWIIEAVTENMDVKRQALALIDAHRKESAIVTTNTSGLSVHEMVEGCSEGMRRHFFGAHFFNPPRYMRLLEFIPTKDTSPDVIASIKDFAEQVLGKGVIICKDTPNFVGNRIGTFDFLNTLRLTLEQGLSIEEVDAITGPPLGRPRSGTFRLADLIGLDTLMHIIENLDPNKIPNDEHRHLFVVPEFLGELVRRGWLGEKTKSGFYRRVEKEGQSDILALDLQTLQYRPRQKVRLPSVDAVRDVTDPAERIRRLVFSDDAAGRFAWEVLSGTLIYAAFRIPEIADDIITVDRAMRWGYNWELGPFEIWDALGVPCVVERLEAEGNFTSTPAALPPLVRDLLASGKPAFYEKAQGRRFFFDVAAKKHRQLIPPPHVIDLTVLKEQGKLIKSSAGASLIDLGDGVACVEFHTKMNVLGPEHLEMMQYAMREVERNFDGLVIGNQGEHFSTGYNLALFLASIESRDFDALDRAIRQFQTTMKMLRSSPKPVVAAPFGYVLGGGCEVCLAADAICADAESYMGLVELRVGLIPAGGGCKEMLARHLPLPPDPLPVGEGSEVRADKVPDLFPFVQQAFEIIANAMTSGCAHEAQKLKFMRSTDIICASRDRLLHEAKQMVRRLAESCYCPPPPRELIALGTQALAHLQEANEQAFREGQITEYECHLRNKLAFVLCGGELPSPQKVSEQYLLDLERDVFLSICGEPKTKERIKTMLETGRPVRN